MILNLISGGSGLRLRVLGGTSLPADPAENTVWVNTDQAISSWVLSPLEPEDPREGMVWISLWGADSPGTRLGVKLMLLEENGLEVCPIRAKQYLSGAWTEKEAKSWQEGGWKSWLTALYLYRPGDECAGVTGGWLARGLPFDSSSNDYCPTIVQDPGSMTIVYNSPTWRGGVVYAASKLNLTNYRSLRFRGSATLGSNELARDFGLAVWSSLGASQEVNRLARLAVPYTETTGLDKTLDISSLTGEAIIGIYCNAGDVTSYKVFVEELWLE